jgi:ABC-type polysaccharide/polyol phosphate transport system ATPase subunit
LRLGRDFSLFRSLSEQNRLLALAFMLSIVASNIHVEFPIYDGYTRSFRHTLGLGRIANKLSNMKSERLGVGGQIDTGYRGKTVVKALDGLSFELREGDRIGLLGHNGSGKTTLLRTLAGIYEPITGDLRVEGKVTPLFDLQLGMDPDATGVENIWLRGRLLDFSSVQIEEHIDDIAEFTELGNFLQMPIRTYSTGMLMRLAFGISTAITPDILILDEMIGAGDAAFIERAKLRLQKFIDRTGILVLASHNFELLRQWCNRAIVLDHGHLVAFGSLEEGIACYEASR